MMRNAFKTMCRNEDYVDVTIWCEKHVIRAHKCILAGASGYFDAIFKDLARMQPVQAHTLIAIENVRHEDLQAVIRYIYDGQIRVPDHERGAFLAAARLLGVVVDAEQRQATMMDADGESGISSGQTSIMSPLDQPATLADVAKGK